MSASSANQPDEEKSGEVSSLSPNRQSTILNPQLYGILDLGYTSEACLEDATRALLEGGVGLLQLRAKGHTPDAIRFMARRVLPLCRAAGVPLIINDFPEIAREVGADGIHIGQDDGSLVETRAIVGPDMIVGRSTHSVEQAQAALAEGFDYIGFGPLFPTPTKKGRPGIGMENIPVVEETVGSKIPVFCIGGIRRDNLPQVLAAGAKRVVIVSDLLTAPDIKTAVEEAKAQIAPPSKLEVSHATTRRRNDLEGVAAPTDSSGDLSENDIAKKVMDIAFQIHRELGPGLLETVYEVILARKIAEAGIAVERQVPVRIIYEGISFDEGFRADLIVGGKVIIELKSIERLQPVHGRQLMTYLRLTNLRLGLLINFGEALLKDGFRRVVNGLEEV